MTCLCELLATFSICLAMVGCGLVWGPHGHSEIERAGEREFVDLIARNRFRFAINPVLMEPTMRVATRILDAARSSPYAARTQQLRWDVVLIDAPGIANAFATPGGRIVVFTGLFPIVRTEAGLAAVLGHEVAHVLEQHSFKEASLRGNTEAMATLAGLLAEIAASTATKNGGLGKQIGEGVRNGTRRFGIVTAVLPYSREQEMEADRIGVDLAARAGYDPREALVIWERMSVLESPQASTQLSTHPAAAARRAALQTWSFDALMLYRGKAPGAADPLPDPAGTVPAVNRAP